jgi:uncharacterized iron-regulated protein
MKNLFIISLFLLTSKLSANIIRIYDTDKKINITYEDLIKETTASSYVVMGEFHNDLQIQKAEGQIIKDTILNAVNKPKASVMWEFLNFTEQSDISLYFNQFITNQISVDEFLKNTAGEQNATYAEVINVAKEFKTSLIGLNLPRDLKQKVIKGGLTSIDSKLIPPSHYLGGLNYYSRFNESMGGHVPEDKVKAYYLAQCLTDSVMAHHALANQSDLNFIIAGSFHTDFTDGTVEKLTKLTNSPLTTLKIVNDDNLEDSDRSIFENGDLNYGQFANFIIFTSEK